VFKKVDFLEHWVALVGLTSLLVVKDALNLNNRNWFCGDGRWGWG